MKERDLPEESSDCRTMSMTPSAETSNAASVVRAASYLAHTQPATVSNTARDALRMSAKPHTATLRRTGKVLAARVTFAQDNGGERDNPATAR